MKVINRFGRVEDFPEKIAQLLIKAGSHKAYVEPAAAPAPAPKPKKAKKAD